MDPTERSPFCPRGTVYDFQIIQSMLVFEVLGDGGSEFMAPHTLIQNHNVRPNLALYDNQIDLVVCLL